MAALNIRRLFEAGAHFGHQTRFWNPKMAPYIYGECNKIHIIDLDVALPLLKEALDYLESMGASGGKVLFVGTKRAAQKAIEKHAERCGMPYVSHRWLGGMLTNFKTVRLSVKRYLDLEEQREKNDGVKLSKKQALRRDREIAKMGRNFDGIRDMRRLPDALFVIDVRHEKIAVSEASKLGIPIVAVVDTNNLFENVDYMVPGNDDALRAVELYVSAAADAVLKGVEKGKEIEELADAQAKEAVKGVITVGSKGAAAEKAGQPVRGTLRQTGKKDEEPGKAKPKVRMRGLSRKAKGEPDKDTKGRDDQDGKDGKDGKDGQDGQDGQDGKTLGKGADDIAE